MTVTYKNVLLLDDNENGLIPYIPPATSNSLGVVKPGANLTIDADGTLNASAGSGSIESFLDLMYPVGVFYFSYDYNNGICPLADLRAWTWTYVTGTLVTSVDTTASVSSKTVTISSATANVTSATKSATWNVGGGSATVSIKGNGYMTVHTSGLSGLGDLTSPNCYFYTSSTSSGSSLKCHTKAQTYAYGFSTTAGYAGLTGSVTVPSSSGSESVTISGQTATISGQTATVSGQTASIIRTSLTCYSWRRTA